MRARGSIWKSEAMKRPFQVILRTFISHLRFTWYYFSQWLKLLQQWGFPFFIFRNTFFFRIIFIYFLIPHILMFLLSPPAKPFKKYTHRFWEPYFVFIFVPCVFFLIENAAMYVISELYWARLQMEYEVTIFILFIKALYHPVAFRCQPNSQFLYKYAHWSMFVLVFKLKFQKKFRYMTRNSLFLFFERIFMYPSWWSFFWQEIHVIVI